MADSEGKNKKLNQSPEERKSFMLNRCAHLVSIGGSELEEKLKACSHGNPLLSFVSRADPDHALYKQKIAEYTVSPPPADPSTLRVDLPDSRGRFRVLPPITISPYTFMIGIPQGMMLRELGVIKFTAQFVARYGFQFADALLDRETQFQFLKKSDGMHKLFSRTCLGYAHIIKPFADKPRKNDTSRMEAFLEGFSAAFLAFKRKQEEDGVVEKAVIDRRDFVLNDEYFIDIESQELPPRDSLQTFQDPCLDPKTFRIGIPEGGMMRKELSVIKFTAQFVARYGSDFRDALWDRVCAETEFQFLKKNPGNDDTLFSRFVIAYGNVIKRWPIKPEAVLEGFSAAFLAFKKKKQEDEDEVVEVTDRSDFVIHDEYFLDIEFTLPQMPPLAMRAGLSSPLSLMRVSPSCRQPGWSCPQSALHAGSSREPEPKRRKFEVSDLVPEEEFLAQRPGSCAISVVWATTGRVIQIRVQSLWENVGSLKEKIAVEMGIPANKQMLIGKTGLLKDDMSLAYYNVGAGEMGVFLLNR